MIGIIRSSIATLISICKSDFRRASAFVVVARMLGIVRYRI